MESALFNILLFPGLLFLVTFGMLGEFIDRKLYARMQNRKGPPLFQPLADFIKLIGKENIVPEEADRGMFRLMPILALVASVAAVIYIPLWKRGALFSFEGDVVVVLYFLTIPTVTFFLGGWYSRSVYSMIGAARTLAQLFAFEVPLFVSVLGPALLAGTWSLSRMTEFYAQHPSYMLFNIVGFAVAVISFLGKIEKTPFDIPEAETEIVAGNFTEFSGYLLAFFRTAINVEMIVGSSLIAAVFLPFGLGLSPAAGFVIYVLKVLFIITLIALVHTIVARIRIDQMISVCWRVFAPLSFVQILISLTVKRFLNI
jgi:NADH-quinone oxidoreductase subunit H